MFWLRATIAAICCFTCLLARNIPSYDYFDDTFYSELRNLLDDREVWKGGARVGYPKEDRGWVPGIKLGQVAGVSVDPLGQPVVFHRGPRVWDYQSFNTTHHYQGGDPLDEDVVVVLDPETGEVVRSWGRGRFLLPHGITVDDRGNTWLTDVALHQVFKFAADGGEPLLTLGEARVPGSDDHHFCKPTSVAVAASGEFYVADGYCNARIIRFDADGSVRNQFGHQGESEGSSPPALYVPHGLALDEARDALCVADRENRRVLCLRAGLRHQQDFGEPVMTLQEPSRGRVFDVDAVNGVLVGVAGSEEEGAATGFTADLDTGDLLNTWAPAMGFHDPHSIAISKDATAVYVAEIGPNRLWRFVMDTPAGF
ncbi:peptidyl-alpha-hydroxyglycine alpha-amidating lyase 2-like [Panulirus ornatus]|uniref:peptidyl-alpha-hydroxyglycine alpha-amidating lyase 2-like n=1 Tax=Panulirus ornatus TaxID=150431 RepID=UPI003A844EF0